MSSATDRHDTEVIEKHGHEHGRDTDKHDVPEGHGHDHHAHAGHDEHGHDDHAAHGHHAPPAPKYLVAPPARVGEITVRSWVAYGIFLLMVLLVAGFMLAGFGK